MHRIPNDEIAAALERIAALLDTQHAESFRVRAYRLGAATCRAVTRPLWEILETGGEEGLDQLPHIGKSLASTIGEFLASGRMSQLDRLEGQVSPEDLFTTIPGVGEKLARRLHDELGVETLEELEVSAHDGRLEALHGFGPRRVQAIRDALEAILSRSVRRRARLLRRRETDAALAGPPAIATLLWVDEIYRRKAAEGKLRTIAPRRFNPKAEAWLPILHVARDGWHITALFSNTARAHRLGKTRDWVVLFCERDGHEEQVTVVTEHQGPRAGRRVVRGREAECP